MEPIHINSVLSFICYFGILIGALAIIAKLIIERGKRNTRIEKEYQFWHDRTQDFINSWSVTEKNYNVISGCIDHLKTLEYRNLEKTSVLENAFYFKYKSIIDEIDSREEFDPEQVFKK
jgi:hypothetical protein